MSRHASRSLLLSLAATTSLVATGSASAAIFNATLNSQDAILGESDIGTPAYLADSGLAGTVGVRGSVGSRDIYNTVIGFTLPVLDAPILDATFGMVVTDRRSDSFFQVDLYGLSTTNPDGTGTSLYFEGALDGAQTLIEDEFTTNGAFETTGLEEAGGITLVAFLNSLYTGTTPNQSEVFFRVNADRDLGTSPLRRVEFDASSASLVIETVPEPGSLALIGLGGAMLLCRHRV